MDSHKKKKEKKKRNPIEINITSHYGLNTFQIITNKRSMPNKQTKNHSYIIPNLTRYTQSQGSTLKLNSNRYIATVYGQFYDS